MTESQAAQIITRDLIQAFLNKPDDAYLPWRKQQELHIEEVLHELIETKQQEWEDEHGRSA